MRISVRVKTNARQNEVRQLDETNYLVSVTAPPVDGQANERMIEVLSDFFKKPKRCFIIIRGGTSKNKIVEVAER